jgi:hypothetical protein
MEKIMAMGEYYDKVLSQCIDQAEAKGISPEELGGILYTATMPVVGYNRDKELQERRDARAKLFDLESGRELFKLEETYLRKAGYRG